jgi:hypothetical protein
MEDIVAINYGNDEVECIEIRIKSDFVGLNGIDL